MKIKYIRLHPFAGITDKEIEFSDGLNLIFGPNEAGKSTFFNAIQHGLLTTTNLTSRDVDKLLRNFFPLGGGDVIRVTMEIQINGDSYKLFKKWKPGTRNGASSLIKPDGTEMTHDEDVQNWILANLPVKAATMRVIMLAKQSALHQTLAQVEDLSEVKQDIGAVLRKSIMETGGISVDEFREYVNEKYEEFFDHWDRSKRRPKQDSQGRDRGIDHKWAHPKGVLEKWYVMEEEKRRHAEIVVYENTVDKINQQLQEKNDLLTKNQGWLDEWEPKLDQLREKETLQEKVKNFQKEYDELQQIAEQWPVYKKELKEQEPKLEKYKKQIENLDKERELASQKSKLESLKKRVAKLNEFEAQISDLNNHLKKVPKITKEDFETISSLQSDIKALQAKVNASELSLNIEALQDAELKTLDTDGEEENFKLTKGETKKLTQKGVATLQTDQLRIRVVSGTGNIDEAIENLEEKNKELKERLANFDSSSVTTLKPKYEKYQELASQKENKQSQYQELLEEDSLEDLKKQLKEVPDFEKVREMSEIQEERDEVASKRSELISRFEDMSQKVEEWKEMHTNTGGVFSKLGTLTNKIESLEKKLKDMPELPEQFEKFETFNNKIKHVEASVIELKDEIKEVELKMASLDDQEVSAEEQENIMEDAESAFENTLAKAESLHRVKEKTDEILNQLEEKTYTPLVKGLIKWLSKMSNGRFEEVRLQPEGKEIPDKFVTSDNKEIPFALLSHGTKDLTALAWRLTVIEQFLQDKESFILLDDPLVDMDSDRKKWASRAIEEMAEGHQVLLFSCHQEIKKMLGGKNTILLSPN